MDKNEKVKKSWRERLFKPRTMLIILAIIVILGGGIGAGLVKASDNPAFCQACHLMQPYYDSWHDSNLLANKHAEADTKCHDCHESSVAIQAEEGIKFVTGDYKDPLDKRDFTSDFCLKCHDFEEVKDKTNFQQGNPHDSHNGEQECNLCHSMHQQSQVMCSQCHQFEWIEDLDSGWKK